MNPKPKHGRCFKRCVVCQKIITSLKKVSLELLVKVHLLDMMLQFASLTFGSFLLRESGLKCFLQGKNLVHKRTETLINADR